MPATISSSAKATQLFTALGTPDELWKEAQQGCTPAVRPKVNAHLHLPPNFSAFDTVEQTVRLAAEQQVTVLGASNYYDYSVYDAFATHGTAYGVLPIFGLEVIVKVEDLAQAEILINDPGVFGKMYFCGKGMTHFDPPAPAAAQVLDTLREGDMNRIATQTAIVSEIFCAHVLCDGLTAPEITANVAKRHECDPGTVYLQERHVAQAFQEAFFAHVPDEDERRTRLDAALNTSLTVDPADAVAVQGAIRTFLMKDGKPACVEASLIDFQAGYDMVTAMGGIPTYPVLADGIRPITPYEAKVDELIGDLHARNVHCVEFIPTRNDPDVLTRYVTAFRDAGLIVTAGTEHNTLDLIPIEPTCVNGAAIPEPLQAIFWEGACVLIAHQFLSAHGEAGFVSSDGTPNTDYQTADERIVAFANLGAAVIQRFLTQHSSA